MAVKEGEIAFAYILDPDGNPCRDNHPVMIFRTVAGASDVWVAGISSNFTEPIPKHWLRLPWSPDGHAVTGLYLDSVLKCNWVHRKAIAALSPPIGIVPPEIFELATNIILSLAQQKQANPGTG